VTLGLELTSKNWITGFTQDVVNNMAIGSGKRETSLSDTDLEYEEYRKGIDGSSVTKPSPSETLVEARIAPGVPDSQPFEIREIGWFTGTSDDSDAFMFSRIDLQDNPVPKDDDTEVRVIYQVGFKNV